MQHNTYAKPTGPRQAAFVAYVCDVTQPGSEHAGSDEFAIAQAFKSLYWGTFKSYQEIGEYLVAHGVENPPHDMVARGFVDYEAIGAYYVEDYYVLGDGHYFDAGVAVGAAER